MSSSIPLTAILSSILQGSSLEELQKEAADQKKADAEEAAAAAAATGPAAVAAGSVSIIGAGTGGIGNKASSTLPITPSYPVKAGSKEDLVRLTCHNGPTMGVDLPCSVGAVN